jgi:hypothetical protein
MGTRTRDLPACSIMFQETTIPLVPDILNRPLIKRVVSWGLNFFGTGYGLLAGCCEDCNEPFVCTVGWESHEPLCHYERVMCGKSFFV